MKTVSVAFVLTGLLAVTLAYPLRNTESEEREALVQMLLRSLIGGNNKFLKLLVACVHCCILLFTDKTSREMEERTYNGIIATINFCMYVG